jgi:hypothetical protein
MLVILFEVIICFYYWYFVKCLESNRHLALQLNFDVCDSTVYDDLSVPLNHRDVETTVYVNHGWTDIM